MIYQVDHDENHRGSVGIAKKGMVDLTVTYFETKDLNQRINREFIIVDNIISKIEFANMEM